MNPCRFPLFTLMKPHHWKVGWLDGCLAQIWGNQRVYEGKNEFRERTRSLWADGYPPVVLVRKSLAQGESASVFHALFK